MSPVPSDIFEVPSFDYHAKAGLYVGKGKLRQRQPLDYRAFRSAWEAISFAMEELPLERLDGICLEVDEARFGAEQIRSLYEAKSFPSRRQKSRRVRPASWHAE